MNCYQNIYRSHCISHGIMDLSWNVTQHLNRNVRAIPLHGPLLSVAPPQTPPPPHMQSNGLENCLGHIETCRNIFLSILGHFH